MTFLHVFTPALRRSIPRLLLAAVLAAALFRARFSATPVQAVQVVRGHIAGEVAGTGTLESRTKTVISPRIQERLAKVLVDQNDFVQAGQLLARLDDGELRRQADVAEAALAGARSTADRIRVDEARAQAVVQQAQLDHRRTADLVANQVSSTADLDKAVEQLRVAEADLDRARAATAEAARQVITAERNLDYHRERLGFAELRSPYDGLITRRDRDAGGVVVPGSAILHLIATNELWISAWVDETKAAALAPGQSARVVFRSTPDQGYAGEVARLGRETDRETREFVVDVQVDPLPPNWTLGQRAEVFIETGRRTNALVVPLRFVQWNEGKPGVWIRDSGRASWREIRLGLRGQDRVEVLEGLTEGEWVVASLNFVRSELKDGQRVIAP